MSESGKVLKCLTVWEHTASDLGMLIPKEMHAWSKYGVDTNCFDISWDIPKPPTVIDSFFYSLHLHPCVSFCLQQLIKMPEEVSQSTVVYGFFSLWPDDSISAME